jgi:hypothetical protein
MYSLDAMKKCDRHLSVAWNQVTEIFFQHSDWKMGGVAGKPPRGESGEHRSIQVAFMRVPAQSYKEGIFFR